MRSSISEWERKQLAVRGFPKPLVPGTWHRLEVAPPSAGGAVGSLVAPGGIGYGTGYSTVTAVHRGRSGLINVSHIPDANCLEHPAV